ncbi:alcohol dehydrogenase [Marasmius tenuissimus]|uniref:alcohol dehydrogenase n=1 Tax=Marasmius tenuissimus TaxID=585030 RepID=A0ABR2Z9Q5_9AGAR
MSYPKSQNVAVVDKIGGDIQFRSQAVKPQSQLAPGECLVKMVCSGACHTDLHAAVGDWPVPPKMPLVGGHEGVGHIVAIGQNTANSPVKVGDRVGIKWLANSYVSPESETLRLLTPHNRCLNCEDCRKGREQNCANAALSGYNVDGTFQEYVLSWVHHVTPIPEGLSSNDAAPILCAGVTTYRAIKYSQTETGDFIVLPGAGGGLGHLAVQYARVRGLRVIAIDTGKEKRDLCIKLGAEKFIDFKTSTDIVKDVIAATDGRGAHAAVVTSSASSGYTQALNYLRPGGALMVVGLPPDATIDASVFFTVFHSHKILGSYVGNRQDAVEALDIAARGHVKVHSKVVPLSNLPSVYEGFKAGTIAGRIVLDIAGGKA